MFGGSPLAACGLWGLGFFTVELGSRVEGLGFRGLWMWVTFLAAVLFGP